MTLIYEGEEEIEGKTSENRDVTEGEFLELVPNKRIVKTVHFQSKDKRFSGEMIQKWLLEAHSEGTKVTVICEDVPEGIRNSPVMNECVRFFAFSEERKLMKSFYGNGDLFWVDFKPLIERPRQMYLEWFDLPYTFRCKRTFK